MRINFKKFLTQITAIAVIFWSLGPAVFIGSLPVQAAVSTLTATAIASRNQTLGASSPATAVLGLNVAQNAGEQLSQVVVTFDPPRDGNNNPTGTIAPSDFANLTADANSGVAFYKDNQAGGVNGVFDATDTIVTLAGAPSFNTNTQFVRLTPSVASVLSNQNIPLTDGDIVFTRTSSDASYTWHIVKTGNTGNEGPINSQTIRLEDTQNSPAFSNNFLVSKFTPEATGNFIIDATANTTQFSSGATPALSVGDILLYSGGSTLARWGLVSGAFTAANAPLDGQNLANGTYRMSRVAGITGSYSVPPSGAITVTGNLNGAPLAAGDTVLYRDTSTTAQAQWGVVTNTTLTSGFFAIDGVPLAPGTTITPKSYQITKLNAYVNATKLLTNNTATNVDVGTVVYALVTSNIENGAAQASVRNAASWQMVSTAGTVTNATENLKLKFGNNTTAGSAGYPVFGTPATLRVTLAANALQAVPTNDTDADKVGADYFAVIKSAATPTANNAFRASIASTYFTAAANQIGAVLTPTYTFNPIPAAFLAVAQQQIGVNTTLMPSSDTYYALKLNLAHSNLPNFRALRVVVNPSGTATMNDLAPITNDATSGITLLKDNKASGGIGAPDGGDTFVGNTFEGINRVLATKRTIQSSLLSRITPTATVTDNGNTPGGMLAVNVGDAVFARIGAGSYRWYMVTGAGNLSSDVGEGTAQLDNMGTDQALVVPGSQISKLAPQNGTGLLTVGGEANLTTVNVAADDIVFYQKEMDEPKWDIVVSGSTNDITTLGTPLSNGIYQVSKFTPDVNRTNYAIGDVVLYQNNSKFAGDAQFALITGFDRDGANNVIGYTLSSGETVPLARLVKFTGFAQLSKDIGATDYTLSDGDMILTMPTTYPTTTTANWHVVTTPNGGALGMNNAVRLDDIGAGAPRFDGTVVVLTPGTAGAIAANDTGSNVQSDYFVGVRTSAAAANNNAFTVSVAADSLILNSTQQGTFIQPLAGSTSVTFTVSTASSMTTNAAANIAGASVNMTTSSNPTAVFGLNTVSNGGIDQLKKVSTTLNPVTGFIMSELSALGTNAQSGIALYQDNKATGTSFGAFNATDDAVVPLSSIATVQQGPRMTTVVPSSQALATAQMTIAAGDTIFTNITGNGAPLNAYAWHMVTTSGTANTAPSGDGALRLDGAGAAPIFDNNAHVSKLTARTTGSYVINGRTNTLPSALKTGDIVLYQSGAQAARWGIVTKDFDAGNAQIDGAQLTNGTYQISKFSPQLSQMTALIGFDNGSQYMQYSAVNWGTGLQNGDIVLYQTGTESARWGIVTNASTTAGTFAINGEPLASGNGYDKVYRFSKLDSAFTQTILAFSDNLQAPIGNLTFAFVTALAQSPTAFDWHVVTTAGAINGTSIRFDGNTTGSPVYGTRVAMNINPANYPTVPPDNNGNNANNDFYIVVRTSATAITNDSFRLAMAPGDIVTTTHTPITTPNIQVSQLHTISSAPPPPPPIVESTAVIRSAEFTPVLKGNSSETSMFRVRFGTNENEENLVSVKMQLFPAGGTSTWTTGQAVSSDLADLAIGAASGISLWKDNGDLLFNTANDTNVTLAANPVYAASDLADVNARSFTMTAATPQAIVSGDAYFIAIKTKAAPVNNNRFSAYLTANSITTSVTPPNLGSTIQRDAMIDTSVPTIQSVVASPGTNTIEVRFSEPVQKVVGGGELAFVSTSDPFTFVDGGGGVQQITNIAQAGRNDTYTVTFNTNLDTEDTDGTPATIAATANKIADFAGNVMDTATSNLLNSMRITTRQLPAANAGQQYLAQGQPVVLQGTGGTQPLGWTPLSTLDSNVLSALGLSLASNTGVISGTVPALASGTHTFTTKLRDNAITATVFTGVGASPWTYRAGGYVPSVGDIVLYRNVTDLPTAINWGIVTAAPNDATRTNQDTFRINGVLLTNEKTYQVTRFNYSPSLSTTSAIAANGNFTQGLNLGVGDIVFYPTNATATTYGWGIVSIAQDIAANNPATTLRVNSVALPTYSATGQIRIIRASNQFFSNTAVVTINNGANWTINSGTYDTPMQGHIVLYRDVTTTPETVIWGAVTAAGNTSQETFRINNQALVAGRQYQISRVQTANGMTQAIVGTNQSNLDLVEYNGDILFMPTQSNGTAHNWALVTGGDVTIPANTNIAGLRINGAAVDMAYDAGAGGSLISNVSPPPTVTTQAFTITVASADGRIASISRIEPNFGVVGTARDITVTGINTAFSAQSTIELLNGSNTIISTEGAATATNIQVSNKALTLDGKLTFRVIIGAQVAQGSYQMRITSGNQVVSLPNAFAVGAAQQAGFNLLSPFDNATNTPVEPMFVFAPSANANVQSYRITVNTSSDFTGTVMWDYVFPKVAPSGMPGHCSNDQCSVQYGERRFKEPQDPNPIQLSSNTPYFWKVETYSLVYTDATIGAAGESRSIGDRILEAKPDGGIGRQFTTTATAADTEAPDMQFFSVPKTTASTDLNMFARIFDRVARPNGTPALTARVLYCNTANCVPATAVNATHVGSNFFKFTIPAATIGVATTVTRYYLEATDGPNTVTTGTAASPLSITSVASGNGTISGTVKKMDGTCDPSIRQAVLFMEGTGFNAVSSNDAACTFALNGLTAGGYIWVIKGGYEPRRYTGDENKIIPLGSTGLDIRLESDQGGGFIGGGGAAGNPIVLNEHFPGTDANEIPPDLGNNRSINIFFDRAMDFGTISSANMTIQDEINGVFTDITNRGVWAYADDTTVNPARHRATWTLTGQNTLGTGKKIVVVITGGVKANGVSINTPDSFNFKSVKKFSFFTTTSTCTAADYIARTCGGTAIALDNYPRVLSWSLPQDAFNVPTNSLLGVNFSVDMMENVGNYNLINSVRLYQITGGQPIDITTTAVQSVALDVRNKKLAIITLKNSYNNGQLTADTNYELKVLAAAAAMNGALLGQDSIPKPFHTSNGADISAPLIVGPRANEQVTISPFSTKFALIFNKPLRPETVLSNVKVYQRGSTSAMDVDVSYDNNRTVELEFPSLIEQTTYDIKVTVGSSGVLGGNGVALVAETEGQTTITRSVTTSVIAGTIDAQAPRIEYINANENKIVVKFTKAMNTASSGVASVTNKNNITIEYGDGPPPGTDPRTNPGFRPAANPVEGTVNVIPATARLSFTHDNELIISNWTSAAAATIVGKKLYVSFAATIEDAKGTAIDTTVDPGFNQDIAQTATLNGQAPCGRGNSRCIPVESTAIMGAAIARGEFNKSLDMRGQERLPDYMADKAIGHAGQVEVVPHSPTVNELSSYTIRIPITEQIPAGGAIQLAFPEGFDVTGAKQRPFSPTWGDFNRNNTGTITFKCSASVADNTLCAGGVTVAGDTAADGDVATRGGRADDGVVVVSRTTVKVYISAATRSNGNDQTDDLEFELMDIQNPPRPMDFTSSDNVVTISTLMGLTQRNTRQIQSMPLMIRSAGTLQITGTITAPNNAGNGTVRVYLEGPGFKETTSTNFNGTATATYTFTGVQNNTHYFVRLDQNNTLGGTKYILNGGGVPVFVDGNKVVDLPLVNVSVGGTAFTVLITGGPTQCDVATPDCNKFDIFARSLHGQDRFEEITLDGNGTNGAGTQLRLSDDEWFIGTGPHIPRGNFNGSPPQINYDIPPPTSVKIVNGNPTPCTGTGVQNCAMTITLGSATKQIRGKVIDSTNANNVIIGSEVIASSPAQGRKFRAQSNGDGGYTLNVVPGSYFVQAFVPGMQPSQENVVEVTTADQEYLKIKGINNGNAISPATAATQFIVKPISSALTIQGKVTDAAGTEMSNMSVYGYRTDGPGYVNGMTDSSGIYRLYVAAGTWRVGTFISGFGKAEERTVTVTTESKTGQDLSAANSSSGTRTYRKISGRMYRDANNNNQYDVNEGLANTQIKVVNATGYLNRDATKSDGTYAINVPEGNGYVVKAFSMEIGGELPPLAAFNIAGADVSNKDFRITPLRTVTFTAAGGTINEGVIVLQTTSGFRIPGNIRGGVIPTLAVPDGSYKVEVRALSAPITASNVSATDVNVTTYAVANGIGTLTVDSNEGLTITIPGMRTITGTVRDANNQPVSEAGVEIFNDASHVSLGTSTAANGTFTIPVPNAATDYILNVSKSEYINTFRTLTVTNAVQDATLTNLSLTLTKATLSIGGQVKIGTTGVAKASVYAKKLGGGFASATTNEQGVYSLPIQSGSWNVFVRYDKYRETAFANNPIEVTTQSGSVAGKDVTLTQVVETRAAVSQSVTPSVGANIEDTTTGTGLIIAANVLPTLTSTNLQIKETQTFTDTDTTKTVGGSATEITATDTNGSPVTTLNGGVTVQKSLTKAQLNASESSTDSSINTRAEVEQMSMSFYDDIKGQWIALPTTFTYKDANGAVVTNPADDLSNIASVMLSAVTTHFSLYAPTVKTNPQAPSAPTGLAIGTTTASSFVLTWNAVAGATGYSLYRSTTANGTFTRVGSEPTVSSGTTTSYTDTGLTASTAYFYKITALNTNGESESSAAVTSTTSTATISSGGDSSGGAIVGLGGNAASATASASASSSTDSSKKSETVTETAKPSTSGKPCDPNLPMSWQAGCVEKKDAVVGKKDAVKPATKVEAKVAPKASEKKDTLKAMPTVLATKADLSKLPNLTRPLFEGSSGADVRSLQEVLKSQGYYSGDITGVVDDATLEAVKKLQTTRKLASPGERGYGNIGPATRAAINTILKEAGEKPSALAQEAIKPTPKQGAAKELVSPDPSVSDKERLEKEVKEREAQYAQMIVEKTALAEKYTSESGELKLPTERITKRPEFAQASAVAEALVSRITSVLLAPAAREMLKEALTDLPEPIKKVGAGQFAAAMNSTRKVNNGQVPEDATKLGVFIQNAMLLAVGRFHMDAFDNSKAENETAELLGILYKRKMDPAKRGADAVAIEIATYGLQPTRDAKKESFCVPVVERAYGSKLEKGSAQYWDIVRACAYSGASR